MPTKTDMRRAGRRDLLRAVERRGGIYAVAQELLGASSAAAASSRSPRAAAAGAARQSWRMPTRAGAAEWNAHLRAVAAGNPELRGARLFEAAAASFSSADESSSPVSSASSSSSSLGVFGGRLRASDAVSDSWDSSEEGDDDFEDGGEEGDEEGEEGVDAVGLALLDSDEDLVLASVSSPLPPTASPKDQQQLLLQQPRSKSGTRRPPSLRDEIDQW